MTRLVDLTMIGSMLAVSFQSGPALAQTAVESHSMRPGSGERATGHVGSVIWTDERSIVEEGARITQPVQKRVFIDLYAVAAYEPLSRVNSKVAFKACSGSSYVCLLDDDGDCTFDRIAKDAGGRGYKLDTGVRYETVQVSEPGSVVTRTIRLLSVSGGRLDLRYQERSDGYRTVVDETYSIPASSGSANVRDVTLKVLDVGPDRIEFEASSSLPSRTAGTSKCAPKYQERPQVLNEKHGN